MARRVSARFRTYMRVVAPVIIMAILAILIRWHELRERSQERNAIKSAVTDAYSRQVEQAQAELRRGDRLLAIAMLEDTIEMARRLGAIPTTPPSRPTKGERLLMKLCEEDAKRGQPHQRMNEFKDYMQSSYPGFDLDEEQGGSSSPASSDNRKSKQMGHS